MIYPQTLTALERRLAAPAGWLTAPFALGTRLYVAWVFLKSGWLKVSDWPQTLSLFETEYRVPLLPPHAAAYAGAAGELVFGALVLLGLAGRAGALGLFAVNLMAFISYRHVLLQDGFEAAVGQHLLWGFMLLTLVVYGPGRWSLDGVLAGRGGAGRGARGPGA
ncbi:MAG TPA: DoxX family protein [Steroidobacteraceae bacterium]|nr:DoxX family protein [Steroidobacteraceae bacterium]